MPTQPAAAPRPTSPALERQSQQSLPSPPAPSRLRWLRRLNQSSPRAILTLGLALIVLIGLCDYLIGTELSLTLFYLAPIALIAWFLGWRWGGLSAFLAGGAWLVANLAGGLHYSNPAIYVWNSLMRLATNMVVAYLFYELQLVLQNEQRLARTDYLTGALNSRAFYEGLQLEIARARRYGHPLTLAYLDLDNFKAVNDRLGHNAGDELLRTIAGAARASLRATDTLARLGGDEFALLLPETGSAEARTALDKVRARLLETARAHQWPVTFSIGVLVCPRPPAGADELVRAADTLMYTVKRAGKNSIQFDELSAPPPPAASAARGPAESPPAGSLLSS